MPSTLEALAVVLVAVLPGALLIFAFERVAGRQAIGIGDRLLRFVGVTAVLHVLLAPATYALWYYELRDRSLDDQLPLWLWGAAAGYVVVPLILGVLLGLLYRRAKWASFLGAYPPTAWDSLFVGEPRGWVLLKLKSGRWLGGSFDDSNYAGGFPEPADLLIDEYEVDQQTEDFVLDPATSRPVSMNRGLLVRWDEIEYLEFQEE